MNAELHEGDCCIKIKKNILGEGSMIYMVERKSAMRQRDNEKVIIIWGDRG